MDTANAQDDTTHPALEQYGILKQIFEYLSFTDLCSASKVSQQWSDVGQISRRQRQGFAPPPALILYHPYALAETKLAVDFFNHHTYGVLRKVSPECQLWSKSPTSCTGGPGILPRHILRTKIDHIPKQFGTGEMIGDKLMEQIKGNYWEPGLAIVNWSRGACSFSSDQDTIESPPGWDSTKGWPSPPFVDKLKTLMPVFGFSNFNGGIFTVPTMTTPESGPGLGETLEIEHKTLPLVSGLLLPKMNGINFDRISLTFGAEDFDEVALEWRALTAKIPTMEPGNEVKGIVLLHAMPQHDPGLSIEFQEYFRKNPNIAFTGGLVERVISTATIESSAVGEGDVMASALVISGNENLKVGSVILSDHRMTENNEQQLKRFKEVGLDASGTSSFAFMFACSGRGRRMHRENHVESQFFRSLYPNTPLIGSFTEGEYFHGFLPGQGEARRSETVMYSFSTAFLFVSYKNSKSKA